MFGPTMLALLMSMAAAGTALAEPAHGIATNGERKLEAGFSHVPYVTHDAAKAGDIAYCVVGTFATLNPFILRSMPTSARGIIDTIFGNLVFEPLMRRNEAEPL